MSQGQDVLVAGAAGLLGAYIMLKLYVGRPRPTVTKRECDAYKTVGFRSCLGNMLHNQPGPLRTAPIASQIYDGMRQEYKRVLNYPLPEQPIANPDVRRRPQI